MIDEELTGRIIRAFYKVYNTLGYGFIESVYHNAMILEIAGSGLSFEVKKPIAVYYGPNIIGNFEADLVVEQRVIVELKARRSYTQRMTLNLSITCALLTLKSACC